MKALSGRDHTQLHSRPRFKGSGSSKEGVGCGVSHAAEPCCRGMPAPMLFLGYSDLSCFLQPKLTSAHSLRSIGFSSPYLGLRWRSWRPGGKVEAIVLGHGFWVTFQDWW